MKKKSFKSRFGWKKLEFFSKNACVRQGRYFFLGHTQKNAHKKSYLSGSKSVLKNKSLMYKQNEILTFEVSIWPTKFKLKFLKKKIMLGPYVLEIVSLYYKKKRKWAFFKLIRIRLEEPVFEARKIWRTPLYL